MTLQNFLNMHQEGVVQDCVSIHQLPYDYEKHGYTKTYFEEESQEELVETELFEEIKNKQVNYFNIIGGGMHKVELCIYLKGE